MIVAVTDLDGYTPLHVASSRGDLHAVNALLGAGADPNVPSRYAGPALHFAALRWHPTVVRALLAGGAHVHATEEIAEHSVTALSKALYDIPQTPSERARLLEVMDRLIDAGVNPHWPDPGGGASNLTRAIGRPVEAVERLIRVGVDLNVRGRLGRTALIDACSVSVNEKPRVRADTHAGIRALLNAGADATIADDDGNTALHLVVHRNDHTLVQALLAAGADPRARNKDGQTPMDRAMHGPHDEVHEQAVLALEMACGDPAGLPHPRERSRL